MEYKDYYEVLGVKNNVEFDEIKAAYREKIKIWHPDKNQGSKERSEEITKVLNEAYHVLSDQDRRRNYDTLLKYTSGRSYEEISDDSFYNTVRKAGGIFFKGLRDDVMLLYKMFRDSVKGDYKLSPLTFGTIAFTLLYFILPTDLISDFIPIIGYIDDAGVVSMVTNTISYELLEYKANTDHM